jgi:flagella basal body P-ring formation protein FlgA
MQRIATLANKSTLRWWLTVLILLGASASMAAADQASVHVPAKVEVNSERFSLGAMAHIDTADDGLAARLEALTIGSAPPVGQERLINRDYVQLRLRQGGFEPAEVALHMPEQVALRRGHVQVDAEEIKTLVTQFIREQHPFGAEASIREILVPDAILLPKGERHCLIDGLDGGGPSRALSLQLTFLVNGQPERRLNVTVRLEIIREVVVTAKPIPRQQPIGPEDLTTRRMNLAELPADVFLRPEEAIGLWARSGIGASRILRKAQVEVPPVVRQGDRVLIVAEGSGLRVTALGEVRDAARPGENVPVLNLDSRKTVVARVLDARTVQVEF